MNRTTSVASLACVALVLGSGCANTVARRDPRQVAGVEERSDREEGTMVLRDGREYPARSVRYEGRDVIWVSDSEEHRMAASEVRGVRYEQRNVARVQGVLAGFAVGTVAGVAAGDPRTDTSRDDLRVIEMMFTGMVVGTLTGFGVGSLFTAPVTYEWQPREVAPPRQREMEMEESE